MLKSMAAYSGILAAALCLLWFLGLRDINILWQKPQGIQNMGTNGTDIGKIKDNSTDSEDRPAFTADDNALSLALENIDLLQGENGIDLWRLRARWANLRQEDGILVIDKPELTYFLHDDSRDFLQVTSAFGEIEQKKHLLRLQKNVVSQHKDNVVTGELLVYDGKKREMRYPSGGEFSGRNITGRADSVAWLLDSQRIEAEGNVTVSFSQTSQTPSTSNKTTKRLEKQ